MLPICYYYQGLSFKPMFYLHLLCYPELQGNPSTMYRVIWTLYVVYDYHSCYASCPSWYFYMITKLKLKMSANLIVNGHLQIYKYTGMTVTGWTYRTLH